MFLLFISVVSVGWLNSN
uniref:Uncharacterized protein n=1 Tax=Lepeophtheirus salmonis TaxID=72036 RepID=A0A0K2TPN6_LEPSM